MSKIYHESINVSFVLRAGDIHELFTKSSGWPEYQQNQDKLNVILGDTMSSGQKVEGWTEVTFFSPDKRLAKRAVSQMVRIAHGIAEMRWQEWARSLLAKHEGNQEHIG